MPDDPIFEIFAALHPEVTTVVLADGGAEGETLFTPRPEHRGNPGWLHGGMAATVLDHVCARISAAAMGHRVVTGKLDLRFRRPVALGGGPYVIRGHAERPRGRTVHVSVELIDHDEKTLVQAKGLFVTKPQYL